MPRELSSKPQPQNWIKFLDSWMQDFYPVLGWGLAPVAGEHSPSQHPHWINMDFWIWGRRLRSWRSGRKRRKTRKSRVQDSRKQRSVTNHPPLSDCTEAQQNKCFGSFRTPEERSYRTLTTSWLRLRECFGEFLSEWFFSSGFRAEKTPKHKDFTKNPMPESTFF